MVVQMQYVQNFLPVEELHDIREVDLDLIVESVAPLLGTAEIICVASKFWCSYSSWWSNASLT